MQRLLLVGMSMLLLLAPQVVAAQDVARWNGLLEEVELIDERHIMLRFQETDVTGGAIVLMWDTQDVCRTGISFSRFLSALERDTDGQVWVATIPDCRTDGYFAVCIDVDGRGRAAACASFYLVAWDIEWID